MSISMMLYDWVHRQKIIKIISIRKNEKTKLPGTFCLGRSVLAILKAEHCWCCNVTPAKKRKLYVNTQNGAVNIFIQLLRSGITVRRIVAWQPRRG